MVKRKAIVKESNAIARARIDPPAESVWDERVIAFFAAQNTPEDTFFREHVIPVSKLAGSLSSRQYRELKKAIKERILRQTYIIPQGRKGFKGFPIFAYIILDDDGTVRAKLNPALCEHFLELKKEFSIRSLPEFSTLTSIYAQQIFRILNSWKGLPEVTIQLDELHNKLSVPESFRKDFKAFRLRVLEVAKREICDSGKTNFQYTWKPIKQGTKVVAIRFMFPPREAPQKEATPEVKQALPLLPQNDRQHIANQAAQIVAELSAGRNPFETTSTIPSEPTSSLKGGTDSAQQDKPMLALPSHATA